MNTPPASANSAIVWKLISTSLISVLIGMGITYMTGPNRDTITKTDMIGYLAPIQKQLDDVAAQNGAHQQAIEQLNVQMARISQKLNIADR